MGKTNFYEALKDILEMQYVGYRPGYEDEVCLDGWFTTSELRRIADTIDAILAEEADKDGGEQG